MTKAMRVNVFWRSKSRSEFGRVPWCMIPPHDQEYKARMERAFAPLMKILKHDNILKVVK